MLSPEDVDRQASITVGVFGIAALAAIISAAVLVDPSVIDKYRLVVSPGLEVTARRLEVAARHRPLVS